jgi:hypothetical protein
MLNSNDELAKFCRTRFLRGQVSIPRHIQLSLWHGVKNYLYMVIINSIRLVENGIDIQCWTDNWLGSPLVNLLNMPPYVHKDFNSTVHIMISNGFLKILAYISEKAPVVPDQIRQVVIHLEEFQGQIVRQSRLTCISSHMLI